MAAANSDKKHINLVLQDLTLRTLELVLNPKGQRSRSLD